MAISVIVNVDRLSIIGCIWICAGDWWSMNTLASTSAHLSWYNSNLDTNSGWFCFILGVILILANANGSLRCEMQYTSWLFIGVSFLATPSEVGILNTHIPFDITMSLIHLSRRLRIWSLSVNPIPLRTELIAV